MKLKFTSIASVALVLCIGAFTSCFDEAEEEKFTVKVICSGSTFNGYIMPDNEGIAAFSGTDIGSSTFYYEAVYEGLNSLFVSATIPGTVNASMNIFIYREDNKVKEASLSVTTVTTTPSTLTLSYDIDESSK